MDAITIYMPKTPTVYSQLNQDMQCAYIIIELHLKNVSTQLFN